MLLLKKKHSLVHGAAVAVSGRGVLLAGWGGTGKTAAIINLLKDIPKAAFLSDDFSIISADGSLLSFPKAFFTYPYHKNLYPHLFKAKHKPMVPLFLSGALEHIRTHVRPAIMALPRLERLARRITPEHMQVPAETVLPDAVFVEKVPLHSILFMERYSGAGTVLDELSLDDAKRRLVGNWNFEQGRCGLDLLLAVGSTAVVDLGAYYSDMCAVLDKGLSNRGIYRLRMGAMSLAEAGKTVVNTVRDLVFA